MTGLALLAAGCGSGSSGGSGGAHAATQAQAAVSHSGTVSVVMKTLAFDPTLVHAGVGQTVVWTNEDNVPHNVIYVSGPKFASSPLHIRNGAKFSIKLTQPGTIHYLCSIHPWMKAAIVVSP